MDYKEYELKVRYPTQDVFVQFEDRYQEFKDFFWNKGVVERLPPPPK